MKTATVQMETWKARDKWREYRKACAARKGTPEDEVLRKAYRFLSLGKRVLNLNETMQQHGLDERNYPKLAIAKADWELCYFSWINNRPVFARERSLMSRQITRSRAIQLPHSMLGYGLPWAIRAHVNVRSVVPIIPPALRPMKLLANYAILFEPQWEAVPKPDPMLLKPLGCGLYLICATWDMTELERAVLFERA